MTKVKISKSPLIIVMVATLFLSLSISYCTNLALAKAVHPKLNAEMSANEIDVRLPSEMKTVRNIDENRGEK